MLPRFRTSRSHGGLLSLRMLLLGLPTRDTSSTARLHTEHVYAFRFCVRRKLRFTWAAAPPSKDGFRMLAAWKPQHAFRNYDRG